MPPLLCASIVINAYYCLLGSWVKPAYCCLLASWLRSDCTNGRHLHIKVSQILQGAHVLSLNVLQNAAASMHFIVGFVSQAIASGPMQVTTFRRVGCTGAVLEEECE